jgi:signal transduction histidine kinase/DNA-binding CsgD family transcriptional regulator
MGHMPISEDAASAAVEAERQRIAALLEDRLVESLALLLAQANAYEHALTGHPQARAALSVLASLARRVLQQVRDLEADLYPQVLETLGLEPALESLVSQIIRTHGVQIRLTVERLPERPPHGIELALFRAVQAALDRAVHHARASRATLALHWHDPHLRLTYTDNGIVNAPLDTQRAACDRIEALGGHTAISLSATGSLDLIIHVQIEPPITLTPREIDVLHLLAEGLSNKAIAEKLTISPRTVNFHLDHVYAKLGVSSRTEAIIAAQRMGLLQ